VCKGCKSSHTGRDAVLKSKRRPGKIWTPGSGITVALRVALPSIVHHGVAGRSEHDARVFIKQMGPARENESDTAVVAAKRQLPNRCGHAQPPLTRKYFIWEAYAGAC